MHFVKIRFRPEIVLQDCLVSAALVVVVAAVKLKKRKSCICPSSLLSPTDLKRDVAGGRLDENNIGTPKWSPFYSHRNWMVDMQIGR